MRHVVPAMLVIAAIIHLIPLSGVLGPERLGTLYGVQIVDAELALLMRHRAVLLGLVGALMLYAAFRPRLQPAALTVGLVSVISFMVLALPFGVHNAQIARVITADVIALACLVAGVAVYFATRRGAG